MNDFEDHERSVAKSPGGGRFQFGMRGLMATIVLLCVPFAIWGGLLRAGKPGQGDSTRKFIFVILSVAAPIGVMMLIGFAGSVARAYRKLRKR